MIPSVAMRTDLYQLTMAQGYWMLGKHLQMAVFDLYFREHPFQGGYAIASGLESVIDAVQQFSFSKRDCHYLATLKGNDGTPLFTKPFLNALERLHLTVDIHAIPEGTLVFAKEPMLRIQGPLWECQLLETLLLNLINFPTLIATKSARICFAAEGDPVIEFGLRRAQGPDGGLTASRAAFIGGAVSTSNVLAGQQFGIPVAGTHAHSWVMSFGSELESFEGYAKAMPNNCVLLVDTYKTLEGVKHAIEVGKQLKKNGHRLMAVRLDSGDLAALSIAARELFDQSGFSETQILASNDLDEYAIQDLKKKGAKIDLWGVGTRLVTGFDQPALGGVYKLVAIQTQEGQWINKAKQTDDVSKQSMPGVHAIKRFSLDNRWVRDVIYDPKGLMPSSNDREKSEDLLIPIFHSGKLVYHLPSLSDIREHAKDQLARFPKTFLELKPKTQYPVSFLKG